MSSLRKTKKLRQHLETCLAQLVVGLGNGARCEVPSETELRSLISRFEKKVSRVTVHLGSAFRVGKPISLEQRLRSARRLIKATHSVSGRLHILLADLKAASNGNSPAAMPHKEKFRMMARSAIASLESTLSRLREVAERVEEQREKVEKLHK